MKRYFFPFLFFLFLGTACIGAANPPPRETSIPLTTGTMTLRYPKKRLPRDNGITTLPVSLYLKDADLREVIEVLAREARLNILFPRDFQTRKVTARFKGVPLPQALRALLKTAGYDYIYEADIYRVYHPR